MKPSKQEILSAALLIAQLTDEDVQKRIKAISSLQQIGAALGSTRIKNQLIPHLKQEITVDEDSRVIMKMLEDILCLGKIANDYTSLFGLLEEVMNSEQTKIREKAVEVYEEAVQAAGIQKNQAKIMLSLKNILQGEFAEGKQGFFRVTAKKLQFFSQGNRQFLLTQYQNFSDSPVFVYRKFAAMYSKYLSESLTEHEATILKIVEILFKDKQQSNKIYLIDTIIALSKYKNPNFLQAYFNLISYQFTWRVRYQLISKVEELGKVLGSPEKFKPFLTYMVKYINDIEPEIRSISCLKLKQISEFVQPDDIVNKIIPALKNIPQDTNVYVKIALAKSLLSLCQKIGKKATSELILPKFLQLLKDEEVKVRLTIFSQISQLCSVIGVDTLTPTTLPAITELASNVNWRIRVQSIDFLFYLIKQSGPDSLNEKIIKLAFDYVTDKANAVRKEGIVLLTKIQQEFGAQNFENIFMPKVMELSKAESYIKRQTFLNCVTALVPSLSSDFTYKNILPLIYSTFVKDPVENVRIVVCQTLKKIYTSCPKQKQEVKKSLKTLMADKDKDVRETATQTNKQLS